MLDARCWLLDTGYWMLDAGCWMLGAGCYFPAYSLQPTAYSLPRFPNKVQRRSRLKPLYLVLIIAVVHGKRIRGAVSMMQSNA